MTPVSTGCLVWLEMFQTGAAMDTVPTLSLYAAAASIQMFSCEPKIIHGSWAKRERDGMCEIREYRSQDDRISTVDPGLREIFSQKNTINKVHNAPLALQPLTEHIDTDLPSM